MNPILVAILAAIPAYVLGSLNGALIASKCIYRKDIRQYGSRNPGLTNFHRVFGIRGALLVVAIDMLKTIIPVIFGGWLFAHFTDMALSEVWLFNFAFPVSLFGQAFAGFFVMVGHCFPLFYHFKGGKAVMTAGTILLVLDWRLALISWGLFIVITIITRYVSLGAIIGVAAFPISMRIFGLGSYPEFTMAVLCALLLIARHHGNIGRLLKGEESKISFKRKK